MREKIIVTNELNKNEILKSLAMRGIPSLNVRVMGTVELAEYVMMRAGVTVKEDFLTKREANSIMMEILSEIKYFVNVNYEDAINVVNAINSLRMLVLENEEETLMQSWKNGPFEEKNLAIFEAYLRYKKYCRDNQLMDGISLIRYAMEHGSKLDADFILIKEFPLRELEEAFVQSISEEKNCKTIRVTELFLQEDKSIRVLQYLNNYGISNEVETVLNQIYLKDKSIDTNVIAVCDSNSYAQSFFEVAMSYDIPMTFGTGIALSNSYPGMLLNLYYHWKTDGLFGVESLKKMIFSNCFNLGKLKKQMCEGIILPKLIEEAGKLRLSDNREENIKILKEIGVTEDTDTDFAKSMWAFQNILSLSIDDFIANYANIRFINVKEDDALSFSEDLAKKLDMAAVGIIRKEMSAIKNCHALTETDIIPQLLTTCICKQSSKEGFAHITSISGAFSVVRENLFIVGLSAKNFPGAPKENYIILDKDYLQFSSGEKYISTARIIKKRDLLIDLVQLYSNLSCNIRISYAGLNVSELKNENASSVIFDLYRKEHGEQASFSDMEKNIVDVDYFANGVSKNRLIGRIYNRGYSIVREQKKKKDDIYGEMKMPYDREFSPSEIDTFFTCKTRFILKYLMHVREIEEFDNLELVTARDEGNLAHSVMEKSANKTMTCEQFLELAKEEFDDFLKHNQALANHDADMARSDFLTLMTSAYPLRPEGQVVWAETEIHGCHEETKIKLHGYPDCIMAMPKQENGEEKYVVIDYKTGYAVKHIKDDINTCLQLVLYAYMFEQETGKKVDHCEVRYLRNSEKVMCKYNDDMKQKLTEKLSELVKYIERKKTISDCEKTKDYCSFCQYGSICGILE